MLTNLNEDKLRKFLMALKASGTQPSPSLKNAITKISGLEDGNIDALFAEVFNAADVPRQNLDPMELTTS